MSERRAVQPYRDAPTRTVSVADADLAHRQLARPASSACSHEFLFLRASGDQLRQIATLADDGALRPIVGKVFPFDQTQSLGTGEGGLRGKAVINNP